MGFREYFTPGRNEMCPELRTETWVTDPESTKDLSKGISSIKDRLDIQ